MIVCSDTLQVRVALSCKNLAVAETSGYQPPDPYAALFAADSRGNWNEVSRTEILQNSRGTTSHSAPAVASHYCMSLSLADDSLKACMGGVADCLPNSTIPWLFSILSTGTDTICQSTWFLALAAPVQTAAAI